jgi:hypothetical protein
MSPATSSGKFYVIIPHSQFTDEKMVSLLQGVGVQSTLLSSPDDLEVMDEGVLSD